LGNYYIKLKSKFRHIVYLLILTLTGMGTHAQIILKRPSTDTLLATFRNLKTDTVKVQKMNYAILQLIYTGYYHLADSLTLEEMRLSNGLGYKKGLADAYNNIGIIYKCEDNYTLAIKYLIKSLNLYDELKDTLGMGVSYKYMGIVYGYQADTVNAQDYFHKALHIFYRLKDTNYIASSLLGLGMLYESNGKYFLALAHIRRSFFYFTRIKNQDGIASSLMNIGAVYKDEKNYDSAKSYFLCAEQIFEELKDDEGISRTLNFMGNVSLADREYIDALISENKSLELGRQIGSQSCIMNAEKSISDIYRQKGDGMNALLYFQLYITTRDSIFSQEATSKILSAEMNYEFENRIAAEKADDEKRETIRNGEITQQRIIIYSGSGILLVLVVFLIFIYRTGLRRKKDSEVIEEKNYQITQSIAYAERIQRAMLPAASEITKLLPQSFILFKPKDIVSGDFYFVSLQNGKIVLAVADCTGHGVPGGFMSMLCSEKLKEAVYNSQNTGEILRSLNRGIKDTLRYSDEDDATFDGMDIGLCAIQPGTNGMKLNYSAALRPLWIIRNGSANIEEIKPTPRTIGGFTPPDQDYGTNVIQLWQGDIFYIFTDGYVDQFGGNEGKKLGVKQLKEFLLSIHERTMAEQQNELEKFIKKWMGSMAQLDDMLLVGVRV